MSIYLAEYLTVWILEWFHPFYKKFTKEGKGKVFSYWVVPLTAKLLHILEFIPLNWLWNLNNCQILAHLAISQDYNQAPKILNLISDSPKYEVENYHVWSFPFPFNGRNLCKHK